MEKHTQGPWIFDIKGYSSDRPSSISIQEVKENHFTGKSIAKLTPICGDKMFDEFRYELEETMANAKLISAAPELLEALQGLMADIGGGKKKCEHDFSCRCAWDNAKLVISKLK